MSKYYKHPKYGHVYGETVVTPWMRCSWPALVTPKDGPDPKEGEEPSKPRFEITGLLDQGTKETTKFLEVLATMAPGMLELFNKGRKMTLSLSEDLLQDGDDEKWNKEKYPYYAGKWILVGRNVKETKVFGRSLAAIDRSEVKGGMLIRLEVTPMITAHGMSFKLISTQLGKDDGVRYGGGGVSPGALLEAVADDDAPEGFKDEEDEEPAPKAAKGKAANVKATPVGQAMQAAEPKAKGKKAALDLV